MPFDESAQDEIRRFEEQFRKQPESLVFARLADAYRKSGDSARALEVLEEGIRRHPDYLSAHIVRARTFRDLGRTDEARSAFERVIEIDAENLVAIRGLAALARDSGDQETEVFWLERLEAADPQSEESSARLDQLRGLRPPSPADSPAAPAGGEWWNDPPPEALPSPSPAGEANEGTSQDPELHVPPGQSDSAESDVDGGERDAGTPEITEDREELVSELWSGPAFSSDPGVAEPHAEELHAAIPDDGITADVGPESESPSPADAWWYEPREATDDEAGAETAETEEGEAADADLLTRTMADLYARQGLIDEAEAIYRELLVDRPDDEALRVGLDAVLGMRAAHGARSSQSTGTEEPAESIEREEAIERDEPIEWEDPTIQEDTIDHASSAEPSEGVVSATPPGAGHDRAMDPPGGTTADPAAAGVLASDDLIRVLREGEEIADRLPEKPRERTLLEEWLENLRS
ncbi:MAG: tetratricopeptide repeat protein [Gemmatimonadota bacterium]